MGADLYCADYCIKNTSQSSKVERHRLLLGVPEVYVSNLV